MAPCLGQCRRTIRDAAQRLFRDIPDLRIGITAHGDYCDAGRRDSYVTKHLALTDNAEAIDRFVRDTGPTSGGDSPECYELVLHEARTFPWRRDARKVLVMIGDDVPHGPTDRQNTQRLDWRREAAALADVGVHVYGVHAMPGTRSHSRAFWQELGSNTGGLYLTLDQFSAVVDLIMAVCYQQQGFAQLAEFETEIQNAGRMTRNADALFAALMGRRPSVLAPEGRAGRIEPGRYAAVDWAAVPPGRFQALHVDTRCSIRDFVEAQHLRFAKGRGFYELTKSETVQARKEIVLQDRTTGDMFTGAKARELLGLPAHGTTPARLTPAAPALRQYRAFVQSTSVNRALVPGAQFLYEVDAEG